MPKDVALNARTLLVVDEVFALLFLGLFVFGVRKRQEDLQRPTPQRKKVTESIWHKNIIPFRLSSYNFIQEFVSGVWKLTLKSLCSIRFSQCCAFNEKCHRKQCVAT